MNRSKLLTVALSMLMTSSAFAADAQAPAVSAQPSRNMAPPSELPPSVSSNDPVPTAPMPISHRGLRLVRQAGIGGPVAYARHGVMELGGALAFSSANRFKLLSFTPSVGYFITDNFELSALLNVNYSEQGTTAGTTKETAVSAVIEPSVHLPIIDQLFVFAGLGLGVAYHQHYGTGFALAPRVGFNVMVGRSGILTPAFNVNWSSNSAMQTSDGQQLVAVHTLLGASLGYSVMF